jgi:Tol biopolymer transport system component
MSQTRRAITVLITSLTALLAWASLAAGAGTGPSTSLVSVTSAGKEVNTDNEFAQMSSDGRFVVFESGGKFTKGDDGNDSDVFVHDRDTGKTTRVSVKANGKEVPGADSVEASISANGRYVAFASDGKFVNKDKNNYADVYVKDLQTGKVTLASLDTKNHQVNANAIEPALSADGRHVAFLSDGAFDPNDMNGYRDVYVRNLDTGKTELASLSSNGTQGDANITDNISISGNGRYVAFDSPDQHMTADSDYGFAVDWDVFVRDLKQNKTIRASLGANGQEVSPTHNQDSVDPVISADGRHVAFYADGNGNYVAQDNNNDYDVYVKNLVTGKLILSSAKSNGDQVTALGGANDALGASERPLAISADGRFVAFEAYAALVGNDTNDERDVYLHDAGTGKTIRVSVKNGGPNGGQVTSGAGGQQLPAISADGRWIAFQTIAKVPGNDSGNDFDVFERGPLH